MNTLNLKVLLNKTRGPLICASSAWLVTALVGSAVLKANGIIGLPLYQVIILSLIFSIPAQATLALALLLGPKLQSHALRFAYAFVSAAVACLTVVVLFMAVTHGYPFETHMRFSLLAPFVIAAFCIVPLAFQSIQYFKKDTTI